MGRRRKLRELIGELGSLSLYSAASVAGALVQPEHHAYGDRRPVVLVPGFLGRGLAFIRLKWALVRQGYPVYIVDLGYGVGCIEEKSRELEAFIDEHELDDFYIVAHSMGGLISMAMTEEARQKVRHFITLGTAFKGAILSYLVPLFPAARQLQPRSGLLRRIVRRAREHNNVTTIVARWDEIAIPAKSCRVEGCDQRTGIAGHVQLIMRSSSFEQLSCLLEEFEDEAMASDPSLSPSPSPSPSPPSLQRESS